MHHVQLICPSSGVHTWQIYAGFALLARQGEVNVTLNRAKVYSPGATGAYLQAIVDDTRIVYDTEDTEDCSQDHWQWADHYFKRSFDPHRHASSSDERPFIHPLGLNYPVTARGDWWERRCVWTLKALRQDNFREVTSQALRLLPLFSRASAAGRDACNYRGFEQSPEHDGDKVLLIARTWDPTKKSGTHREQREAINELRVESIRGLRAALGPQFVGGLMPTDFALRHYRDLVLTDTETSKKAFLSSVRNAAVCVTSTGLERTNGWRLAEFIAASRPILTEPLLHALPGVFSEGQNYDTYTSPEELIDKVQLFLRDTDLRYAMRHANHQYYQDYVRPDSLVRQTLRTVFGDDAARIDSCT